MGRVYHLPMPGAFLRDAVISLLPSHALLKVNDWLYAYNAAGEDINIH
jgi:hypothetical protein